MTAAMTMYDTYAYTTFPVDDSPDGTLNIRMSPMAIGIALHKIHGRALPQRVCVRSIIAPIIRSEIPSRSLDSSIIVPIVAAAIPTLSV